MPVIAMTMEVGTRGSEVAEGVAQALGLALVRHDLADRVADKMHIKKSLLMRLREGKASLLERIMTSQSEVSVFTAEEVFAVAEKGNVVLRGWGSTCLLREVPHVVCVRVCAPLEARVASMMARLDTDDEDFVRAEIQRSDHAHLAALLARFSVTWGDPLLYDITLNTARVSIASCVEQVVALTRRPEFAETPESKAKLANLALAAHVRAALVAHRPTDHVHVTIVADAGRVTLSGMVDDEDERDAAIEVARQVPGVTELHAELRPINRPRR